METSGEPLNMKKGSSIVAAIELPEEFAG